MKKIGLFLDAERNSGGMHQYNQIMLDAVVALQSEAYSVVIACASNVWLHYVSSYAVRTIIVQKGFWGRAVTHAWRFIGLPVRVLRTIVPYFHPVARQLLREQCDLWIFPSQDTLCYQIPVPALATIHDLMHKYERRFPEVGGDYRLREQQCRAMCKWSRGILVDSEVGKGQVIESYEIEEEQVHVLPYIAPNYMYASRNPVDVTAKYNLSDKYIFYPAQFWHHKNHRKLILAIGKVKETIPNVRLVLVGSKKNGYDAACMLVNDMNISDNVLFLGYIPDEDMPELYRRARALIMPTFFGPTNIPPLEAFIAGCPVAVSGVYGIPAQVGDAALLFNPESVDEIAVCIARLWEDDKLCADLVEKGKKRALLWGQKEFNERLKEIIGKMVGELGGESGSGQSNPCCKRLASRELPDRKDLDVQREGR